MQPELEDQTYPLLGKVSAPRMIAAQYDNVNNALLVRYKRFVMVNLEVLITKSDPRSWLTIYLTLFILLREASLVTADRYRHARENYGTKVCPSIARLDFLLISTQATIFHPAIC